MNASIGLPKYQICLALCLCLFFVPQIAFGQEKPAAPTADSRGSVDAPAAGQALNASEEELAGILTPEERASAVSRWESEIAELEKLDRTEAIPADGILLLGSSSIRLWKDAAQGLAPYPVIRRGYGGAKFSDLVVFARRLISPHQYRAVVIFVANDISGSNADRSVDSIRELVLQILQVAKEHDAQAPVLLVDVTPTPLRAKVWPQTRELNAMLRELCLTQPNVYHVPTAEYYLTAEAKPRPELFISDQLHQNEAGYALWADLIRRRLDEVLGE